MEGADTRAPRRLIALLLLAFLAGAGCQSGKWAWQLSDKEKRLDYLRSQEAPAVQRPTPCMETLAAALNELARNS